MSQHPSLRISDKDKAQRSVLKRHERIKTLKEKEKWTEEEDSVYGLPKVKVTRFKIKKEKAAAAAEGAEGAAAPAAPGAAPAKEAGKGASAKDAGKAPAADAKKEAKK
ncbi:MAG: small basic protein [Candidatus Omnitrophota bacterium]|jgi:small basic protein (TIGR04137 family)